MKTKININSESEKIQFIGLTFFFHSFSMNLLKGPFCLLILFLYLQSAIGQDTLELSPLVGKTIDSVEKVQYGLMPYFARTIFVSAVFVRQPDSVIIIKASLKPDSIAEIKLNDSQFHEMKVF